MTPKEAFDNTILRSEKLLKLYGALLNERNRKPNKSWLDSFKGFMRWQHNDSIKRVDTSDLLIVIKKDSNLEYSDFSRESLDDLLRSSLILSVSALDRFIHEKVIKGIIRSLKAKELNREQRDLVLPVSVFIDIAEKVSKHTSNKKRKKKSIRPANEIRNEIQDLLYKKPFQSWREIHYAFNLIGISIDKEIQRVNKLPNIESIKKQMNELAKKRNQIVHEGDLVRHERGGHTRLNKITYKYVQDSIGFLKNLVDTIEKIKP